MTIHRSGPPERQGNIHGFRNAKPGSEHMAILHIRQ